MVIGLGGRGRSTAARMVMGEVQDGSGGPQRTGEVHDGLGRSTEIRMATGRSSADGGVPRRNSYFRPVETVTFGNCGFWAHASSVIEYTYIYICIVEVRVYTLTSDTPNLL